MLEIDKIYNMDCIEAMKLIDDNSIDLVLTDPPYNVGKDFKNDKLNQKDFFYFHSKYLFELKRITKKHHPIILFFNNGSNLKDYLSISGSILSYKRYITIYKPNDCSYPLMSMLRKSEACLVFTDEGSINYQSDINIHDVLVFNHVKKDKTFYHPTVKPIEAVKQLVLAFSKEGDCIFDPFMGSGTTIVACKQLNRRFIGCDVSDKYYDISLKRLLNVPKRLDSFGTKLTC